MPLSIITFNKHVFEVLLQQSEIYLIRPNSAQPSTRYVSRNFAHSRQSVIARNETEFGEKMFR